MKEVTSISRDAFNLLLQVLEHPRMMIGAGTLMDDFPRQASELIESGCLIPAGNQAVTSIVDDDDASFHELVWDSERKHHKYFTAESGWVFIGADSMKAPRRFEWNSPGNLCQITRKIRNEEPEWTATRYCFLGWV